MSNKINAEILNNEREKIKNYMHIILNKHRYLM